MTNLERYIKAMITANLDVCAAIEQKYDLYGYPPEIVTAALKAIDDGEDHYAVIDSYLDSCED